MKVTFKVNAQDNKKLMNMLSLSPDDLIRIQKHVYEQLGKNFVQHTKNTYLCINPMDRNAGYSLSDLAKMGHPYAKNRKGLRRGLMGSLGFPIYKIHRREGDLYDGMIFELLGGGGKGSLNLIAGIHKDLDDLALWLHEGTTKMIRRPFLHLAFRDLKDDMMKKAMRDLRTALMEAMRKRYHEG